MKPGWCFPDRKKSNNIIRERKLYSACGLKWKKDYRDSTTMTECTKKQKTLLGTGSEGYKGLLLNIIHLSVVLADSMMCLPFLLYLSMYSAAVEGTAFPSSLSLPWSTAWLSNGIFKCHFHGKLQLLTLALSQVVLLKIKDKIRSRLQTAEC